jgi:large subunit ribosomal protein L22
MNARAQAKHIRQSPYKVRRVLDLVRGLPVDEARVVLEFTDRKASGTIIKVLDSAVANAEHNFALDAEELYVAEAYADEGPTLKRWRPRARGRATKIRKRTSHITIVVAETEEVA